MVGGKLRDRPRVGPASEAQLPLLGQVRRLASRAPVLGRAARCTTPKSSSFSPKSQDQLRWSYRDDNKVISREAKTVLYELLPRFLASRAPVLGRAARCTTDPLAASGSTPQGSSERSNWWRGSRVVGCSALFRSCAPPSKTWVLKDSMFMRLFSLFRCRK
jgi:hypothetical protein